jgi:hypothetical protein
MLQNKQWGSAGAYRYLGFCQGGYTFLVDLPPPHPPLVLLQIRIRIKIFSWIRIRIRIKTMRTTALHDDELFIFHPAKFLTYFTLWCLSGIWILRTCLNPGCDCLIVEETKVPIPIGAGLRIHGQCTIGHKTTWESCEFANKVWFD